MGSRGIKCYKLLQLEKTRDVERTRSSIHVQVKQLK